MTLMVFQNLWPQYGIVNWTRLCMTQIFKTSHWSYYHRSKKNTTTYIPRLKLLSDSICSKLPFTFAWTQLPVQVAFAMTIDKSQGLTIPHIQIYLPNPVFAQGQLYLALPWCPTFQNCINVFLEHLWPEEKDTSYNNTIQHCTSSVAYKQIFDNNT